MNGDALTVLNVAIDALGLMICIGAVLMARRIGASVAKPAAATAVSFGRDMAQEMLRQRIANAFANISSSLHTEQRALDCLFDHPGNPATPSRPQPTTGSGIPAPAATTETPEAAIDRMVAQGMGMAAIAKALGVTPGEVELRLKLRRPSARS